MTSFYQRAANHVFFYLLFNLRNLLYLIALRDSSPLFEGPKANGSIGIPCFILEDGTTTLELDDVLARL